MGSVGVDAAVGLSRKWDAREAGREVAREAIKDLCGPPKFFVLFSTIHYKDYGGFEELLAGVWDVLPPGTSLVGGTVAGFMNNFGCFARGVTGLAVCCEQMDVAVGVGRNTKRNPKKAARQCARMIQSGLKESRFENKFLLNIVSGPSVLNIPGQGLKKVIDSGYISKFISLAFSTSQYLFQKGFGREDEVFEYIIKEFPGYHMILGTSFDDYKGFINYQFFNREFFTNSVISIGISTEHQLDVCTTHGMKETDITFEITKLSRNKHIIQKINNQSAVDELFKILKWPKGFLTEKNMSKIIPYYPISLNRNGNKVPIVMPFILKDSIMTPCIIDAGEVSILRVNGKELVDAIKKNLECFKNIQPFFGLCSTCITILDTLGYNIEIIKNEMQNYYIDKPFILLFCAGEGSYSPNNDIIYANMSFNTAIFGN